MLQTPLTLPADRFDSTGQDRRRGLRLRLARPVKVFEPRTGRYHAGVTLDVSASGLQAQLPTRCAVAVGQTLSVHVGTGEVGQPLASRQQMRPAKVVWLQTDAPGHLRAGLAFVPEMAMTLTAA